MSLIGEIAGIPLFTTIPEALAWARKNGKSDYHTHSLRGQKGYMGGTNHAQVAILPPLTTSATTMTTGMPTTPPLTVSGPSPVLPPTSPSGGGKY